MNYRHICILAYKYIFLNNYNYTLLKQITNIYSNLFKLIIIKIFNQKIKKSLFIKINYYLFRQGVLLSAVAPTIIWV